MTRGPHAQVWFLQRRFHKDILLNPVLVLSFCPDLSSGPGHLGTATRELLFLLDGSSVAHKACGGRAWAGLGGGSARSGSALGWRQPLGDARAPPPYTRPDSWVPRASLTCGVTLSRPLAQTQGFTYPSRGSHTLSLPHTPGLAPSRPRPHPHVQLLVLTRPAEGRQSGVPTTALGACFTPPSLALPRMPLFWL